MSAYIDTSLSLSRSPFLVNIQGLMSSSYWLIPPGLFNCCYIVPSLCGRLVWFGAWIFCSFLGCRVLKVSPISVMLWRSLATTSKLQTPTLLPITAFFTHLLLYYTYALSPVSSAFIHMDIYIVHFTFYFITVLIRIFIVRFWHHFNKSKSKPWRCCPLCNVH